jgi:hypothetical protein
MVYQPHVNEEFKFWYCEKEVTRSPFQDPVVSKEEITLDIYMADSSNSRNICYG